ncbi:YHS domain-containing protein [Pseudoalteromonas luteoviolacea]|uniref:YHS domain-containing protein n=1 Tax=Pseudoalteromonas luteoviolacea TaxID=43657 RepID=UPI001F2DED07|nr:YHS domain-containing protein [Pseudoalteromonas luteoviolacea]MCF6443055.1 YHS domain-containing protein [Pseudoalteromonas luteoviolacea]
MMPSIAINKFCPRSGKIISPDSLTHYRGVTVGFCNPSCRDDFAENINARPKDSIYFDVLIKEKELA